MSTVSRRGASSPHELTRIGERLSFVYLERCTVHRDSHAITAKDANGGVTHLPSATIGTLLLGPGTRAPRTAQRPADVPRQGWSKASRRRRFGGR